MQFPSFIVKFLIKIMDNQMPRANANLTVPNGNDGKNANLAQNQQNHKKEIILESIIHLEGQAEIRRKYIFHVPKGAKIGAMKRMALERLAKDEQIGHLDLSSMAVRMRAFSRQAVEFFDVDSGHELEENGAYRLEFVAPIKMPMGMPSPQQQQNGIPRSILRRKVHFAPSSSASAHELPKAKNNLANENNVNRYNLRLTPERQRREESHNLEENSGQNGKNKASTICPKRKVGRPRKIIKNYGVEGTQKRWEKPAQKWDKVENKLAKDAKTGKTERILLEFNLGNFRKFITMEGENNFGRVQEGRVKFVKAFNIFADSAPKMAHGIRWKIRIWVRMHWKKKTSAWRKHKIVGIFLHSNLGTGNFGAAMKVPVKAEIKMRNTKGGKDKMDSIAYTFSKAKDDCGFDNWISTKQILHLYHNARGDSVKFTIDAEIGQPFEMEK